MKILQFVLHFLNFYLKLYYEYLPKVEENENAIFIHKKMGKYFYLILCYYECTNLDTMILCFTFTL